MTTRSGNFRFCNNVSHALSMRYTIRKLLETPFLVLPPHLRIENADAAESIWKTVGERYSYHMVKTNRYVKKVSTSVLTRLIEISKQYCIVTMFRMSCIICMDMITKTGKFKRNLPEKLNRGYLDFNFR
ncbi:hypothetical protein T07_11021 [Trichinella nelsoni]|uniref:Uncharacterized protein n=1 Tax=Trichinella nelsoni TaxID=6336 RepID=A0A0V0RH55_9BILA|nr:hypothetical protein T07_11021 [Trichinella nelsoni]